MRNGQVFELPTPAHHTTDSESLSSPTLPTPRSRDYKSGSVTEENALARIDRGYGLDVSEALAMIQTPTALNVLPTPTTQDSSGICRDHGGDLLHDVTCGCSRATRRELMRTPTASQGEGGALGEEEARKRGNTVGIRDQAMDLAKLNGAKVSREVNNLPTPTTRDYKDGTKAHTRDGVVQTDTLARAIINGDDVQLMPTPQVDDSKNTGHNQDRRSTLASEVWASHDTNWGKFEPAIRRWEEVLGRPAPAPTKPDGKDGAHRLSSAFTEFMMGLEPGWITDVGLTRNEELKACGNGVVPQQAELALRILLEGTTYQANEEPVLPTVMASSPMRNSRRSMVTHPTKRSSVALNQALEIVAGHLPAEFENWDEVPDGYREFRAGGV